MPYIIIYLIHIMNACTQNYTHMMHVMMRNSMTRVTATNTIPIMTLLKLEETGGGEDAITKEDVFLST